MHYSDHDANQRPATHFEYILPVAQSLDLRVEVKKEAVAYMQQLEGWCSEQKAFILIDLIQKIRPKKIVEIGVWGGMSFVPMACALRANGSGKIFGIDPWESSASLEHVMN